MFHEKNSTSPARLSWATSAVLLLKSRVSCAALRPQLAYFYANLRQRPTHRTTTLLVLSSVFPPFCSFTCSLSLFLKVTKDDVIVAEKVEGDIGTTLETSEVLLVGTRDSTKVGRPTVPGATVKLYVEEQTRDKKVRPRDSFFLFWWWHRFGVCPRRYLLCRTAKRNEPLNSPPSTKRNHVDYDCIPMLLRTLLSGGGFAG